MKTISKISAAVGLSLLTIGAMAQSPFAAQSLSSAPIFQTVQPTNQSIIRIGSGVKSVGTGGHKDSAYLNYEYVDSLNTISNTGNNYPGPNAFTINSRYTLADTGLVVPSKNPFTFTHAYVAFDTIYDANTAAASPSSATTPSNEVVSGSLKVDSVLVCFNVINTTSTADTIRVRVVGVDPTGAPDTNTIYATNSFTTTTSIGSKTSFSKLVVNTTAGTAISGHGKFAVELSYFGSKLDTCNFIFGFPSITCGSTAYADTTAFGVYIGPTGHTIRANSFTTGYGKYSATPKANTITLPNATNGEGLAYSCSSTNYVLFWQDIYMSAWVHCDTIIPAGINNIAESGLSVKQNYPNPFNKETQISYNLTKSSNVVFTVCDVTGRELMNNVSINSTPGQHQITLNANTFSPGIYFYSFNVNGSIVTNKMVITQ